MFIGSYQHTIDEKGRSAVPSRFRDVMAGRGDEGLVVTRLAEPCLVVFSPREWSLFTTRLAEKGLFDSSVVNLRRTVVSCAMECEVDKSGRILIPQMLREYAALGDDVVWVGQVQFVELWSPGRWNEALSRSRTELAQSQAALAGLVL